MTLYSQKASLLRIVFTWTTWSLVWMFPTVSATLPGATRFTNIPHSDSRTQDKLLSTGLHRFWRLFRPRTCVKGRRMESTPYWKKYAGDVRDVKMKIEDYFFFIWLVVPTWECTRWSTLENHEGYFCDKVDSVPKPPSPIPNKYYTEDPMVRRGQRPNPKSLTEG